MSFRGSLTQSRFNYAVSPLYALQILLVSLIVGVKFGSLGAGILTFMGIIMLSSLVPMIGLLLSLLFAAVWTLCFYTWGQMASDSMLTVSMVTALGFILGFGINASGLAFLSDLSRRAN